MTDRKANDTKNPFIHTCTENDHAECSACGWAEEQVMYIEIVTATSGSRHRLDDFDLWAIGEFTRENIVSWLSRYDYYTPDGFEDFHAVRNDLDIPWSKEKSRVMWERRRNSVRSSGRHGSDPTLGG
jgi:hypothetical protein